MRKATVPTQRLVKDRLRETRIQATARVIVGVIKLTDTHKQLINNEKKVQNSQALRLKFMLPIAKARIERTLAMVSEASAQGPLMKWSPPTTL